MSEPASTATAAFGLGDVSGEPEPVARGAMGQVWKVTTASGQWAVKELFWGANPDSADGDVAFQEAALAAGVRLPRPRRVPGTGAVLVEVDGRPWRAYEWVDLAPPPEADERRSNAAAMGDVLGRLHQAGSAWPGGDVHAWYTTAPPPERWDGLLDAGRATGAPWVHALEAARPELVRMAELVADASAMGSWGSPIRCHRDLGRDNVRPVPGGVIVIDFEDAGPCDPRQELGTVLADWCSGASAMGELLDAYRRAGGPAEVARGDVDAFAMAMAIRANYLAVVLDGTLAGEGERDEHWRFAHATAASMLAAAPSATVFEKLAEKIPS